MGTIIVVSILATLALIAGALYRVGKFIDGNEQRAYVQNVLHAVEVRGELDRQQRDL